MKGFILLAVICPLSIVAEIRVLQEEAETDTSFEVDQADRSGKFFSLFSIVKFANSACTTSGGLNGTCYTAAECSSTTGGTSYGSCASGFGVCCVVSISTCGSTSQLNNTYWSNPGYSSSYSTAGQCVFYATKFDSNICQMRLDFITFNIAAPDSSSTTTAGRCLVDIFTVSGQSNPVPSICGSNANQHIYLDMTPGQNTFTLSMTLTGTNTLRYWDIRISQIPCGANYAAPNGCLQYFMESTGTVTSFNYLYSTTPAVQHLAYQDYTVCVRSNTGYCGIGWSECTSTGNEPGFAISGSGSSLTQYGCDRDFFMFACATDQMSTIYTSAAAACVSKMCGGQLNVISGSATSTTTYSYNRPFQFYFRTDSGEVSLTSGESYGFCLSYTQQVCPSQGIYGTVLAG